MKEETEHLILHLHGPFRVELAGKPLRIPSRRGRALLAMLSCCPDNCLSRSKAQLALWEDRSETQARTSLRQELAALRRALGPVAYVLQTEGDLIRLDPTGFEIAPKPEGAEFLEGMDLPSETFETWLRSQRSATPSAAPPVTELFRSPALLLLPFEALSSSPEDGLLARGLGEDVRTTLAYYRWFPVIGPEALGKDIEGRTLTELCARVDAAYALAATVRRVGQQARVSARLLDGRSGQQLWSQAFDGDLSDVFAFQEEVAARVVAQLEPEILHATDARIGVVRPSLEIWELLIKVAEAEAAAGEGYGTPEANEVQKRLLEEILARDDSVAEAWARLARCHFRDMLLNWSGDRAESIQKAMDCSARAVALNANNWLGRTVRGNALLFGASDPVAGLSHAEAAVRLNPSSPLAHQIYGCVLEFLGRQEESIPHLEAVFRLNPNWPNAGAIHASLMMCHAFCGNMDAAIEHGRKMLAVAPEYIRGLQRAACVFGHADLLDDARDALATLDRLGHAFDEAYIRETYPFQREQDVAFILDGLQKAGWKG